MPRAVSTTAKRLFLTRHVPEFVAEAVQPLNRSRCCTGGFITPGGPLRYGYILSCYARFRDEFGPRHAFGIAGVKSPRTRDEPPVLPPNPGRSWAPWTTTAT
jgi:hypothetical protein